MKNNRFLVVFYSIEMVIWKKIGQINKLHYDQVFF